jgi:hypothetical protein
MRASSMRAAAVAAVLLSIAGCGAPDFGDEPRSYSSNWPHADPTPSESSSVSPSASASADSSASAKPNDGLPATLAGQRRDYEVVEDDSQALKAPGVKNDSASYGTDDKTVALLVYRGGKAGIDRVVQEHRKMRGTKVGSATCVKIGALANLCWRSAPGIVVSVTANRNRSAQQVAPIVDEALRAVRS